VDGALCVWWIGADAADAALMEHLRRGLAAVFEVPVAVWPDGDRPADTWDPRRNQHSSTQILRWLATRRPADARRVLAVTDVDLFIPVLTFVYGEAQLNGAVAVVSTARLGAGPGLGGRRVLEGRLLKECTHELGHTFGLLHCDTAGCAMTRSATLAAVDRKNAQFCPDCRLLLLDRLATAGEGS
jgi:archaemetzincin